MTQSWNRANLLDVVLGGKFLTFQVANPWTAVVLHSSRVMLTFKGETNYAGMRCNVLCLVRWTLVMFGGRERRAGVCWHSLNVSSERQVGACPMQRHWENIHFVSQN